MGFLNHHSVFDHTLTDLEHDRETLREMRARS
jgi:hypothetical protein